MRSLHRESAARGLIGLLYRLELLRLLPRNTTHNLETLARDTQHACRFDGTRREVSDVAVT
eukprot:scaffold285405_cov32-Tisochrysis_lutea.AAC.2